MAQLFDFLNAITNKKNPNIMEEDPYTEKEYEPYKINHFLSMHTDCLEYANMMNGMPFMDKKMQFDFLINSIRKKFRRGEKWLKPDALDNLAYVFIFIIDILMIKMGIVRFFCCFLVLSFSHLFLQIRLL